MHGLGDHREPRLVHALGDEQIAVPAGSPGVGAERPVVVAGQRRGQRRAVGQDQQAHLAAAGAAVAGMERFTAPVEQGHGFQAGQRQARRREVGQVGLEVAVGTELAERGEHDATGDGHRARPVLVHVPGLVARARLNHPGRPVGALPGHEGRGHADRQRQRQRGGECRRAPVVAARCRQGDLRGFAHVLHRGLEPRQAGNPAGERPVVGERPGDLGGLGGRELAVDVGAERLPVGLSGSHSIARLALTGRGRTLPSPITCSSAWRARLRRLITVPTGTLKNAAVSA